MSSRATPLDLPGRGGADRRRGACAEHLSEAVARAKDWQRRPRQRLAGHRKRARLFRRPELTLRRAPILPQRNIGDLVAPCRRRDRHLRCRREPHPDDASVPDQRRAAFCRRRAPARWACDAGGPRRRLVHPDRPVVAVCGDGGFAMTMNGMMTAIDRTSRSSPWCSTTRRSAGCCTAAGRSPPIQRLRPCRDRPRDGLPRRRVRTRERLVPASGGLRVAPADRDRRADLAGGQHFADITSPLSPSKPPQGAADYVARVRWSYERQQSTFQVKPKNDERS